MTESNVSVQVNYPELLNSFQKSYDDKTKFNLSSFKSLFEQIARKLAAATDDNAQLNATIAQINTKIPLIKNKFEELTSNLKKYDDARRDDLSQLKELIQQDAPLPKIEESINKLQQADKDKSAALLQTAIQLDGDLSDLLGQSPVGVVTNSNNQAPITQSNSAKDTVYDLFDLINKEDYSSVFDTASALDKIKKSVMEKNTKFYAYNNDDNYKITLLKKLNESDKFRTYGFTIENINNLFTENSEDILTFGGRRKTRRRKNKRRKTMKKYGGYQTETKKHKKRYSKRSRRSSSNSSKRTSSKRSSSDSVQMQK
jgi:hypothetical protein